MKLGNNLRRCRFEMDEITQEALAKEVGVTRQTIISIEKNRYVPSALLALKLARFFGRRFEDIFYLTEDED
jgi:putative transcriptional regulator